MFAKIERTTSNPKITEDEEDEDLKNVESGAYEEGVAAIKPLGVGKESKEMLDNLVVNHSNGGWSDSDSASGSEEDEHLITPKGNKIRQSMIQANEDIKAVMESKGKGGKKLNVESKRWAGLFEETQRKMGDTKPSEGGFFFALERVTERRLFSS